MFNETINCLQQARSNFEEKVQDNFGKSISNDVFEPVENELGRLEGAYSEAEVKKSEINAITLELRTIL